VTIDEVDHAISKWIAPIFHAQTSFGAACCGAEQRKQMLDDLTAVGYQVEVHNL
jgi:hypothetical protein